MVAKHIITVGERFRSLTVLSITQDGRYLCRCDCGNAKTFSRQQIIKSLVKSCGCLRGRNRFEHGHSIVGGVTPTYRSWRSMIERCCDPTAGSYVYYGGRGIQVCKKWGSFKSFLCDMGERPEGKTLDRFPDKDGDYEPNNCRWATPTQQSNNKRSNIILSHHGETMTLAEWASRVGKKYKTLHNRYRKGFSIERILFSGYGRIQSFSKAILPD